MWQKLTNPLPDNSYKKALRRTRQKPKSDLKLVKDLQQLGYSRIIGIDEVGRGAIAGPLVVCAVEIDVEIAGITDSKLLSKKKREILSGEITPKARQVHYAQVSAADIDRYGINKAQLMAYEKVITYASYDIVLTDFVKLKGHKHISFIKGDLLNFPISCASILAKVFRDNLMAQLHSDFAHFDWKNNAGYGTKKHFDAIKTYGITSHHRQSFLVDF